MRQVSMSDWADIHDEMEVTDRQTAGLVLVTTGEHPRVGAVVAIQAPDGVHVLTELVPIFHAPEVAPRKKKPRPQKRMAWLDRIYPGSQG